MSVNFYLFVFFFRKVLIRRFFDDDNFFFKLEKAVYGNNNPSFSHFTAPAIISL